MSSPLTMFVVVLINIEKHWKPFFRKKNAMLKTFIWGGMFSKWSMDDGMVAWRVEGVCDKEELLFSGIMAWHGMAWHGIAWHGRNWHKSFKGPYCGDESPTRKTMSPLLSNIILYKITLGIILLWFFEVTLELRRDPEVTSNGGISLPFSIGDCGNIIIIILLLIAITTTRSSFFSRIYRADFIIITFPSSIAGDGGQANVVVSKSGEKTAENAESQLRF